MSEPTNCCPQCEGGAGYSFTRVERGHFVGNWGEGPDLCDSTPLSQSLVECHECGTKFQYEKLADRGLLKKYDQL